MRSSNPKEQLTALFIVSWYVYWFIAGRTSASMKIKIMAERSDIGPWLIPKGNELIPKGK
jgi:hypothetical protein